MTSAIRALASVARENRGENPLFALTAIVLCLALAFGGGTVQGLRSDALVHLVSLPLFGLAVAALLSQPIAPGARWALAVAASSMIVVAVQLIPLPPQAWTQLPGRRFAVEAFELTGVLPGWMPLSLDPGATWRSFLSLLAPLAVFLAVLCMGARSRRTLSLLLVGCAVGGVVLGLVQLMQGPDSGLRFHAVTNPGSVGVFANRNHYAALLYGAMPFAAAWTIARAADGPAGRLPAVFCGLALAVLLLGIATAQSRAGAVLGLAALVCSALLLAGAGRQRRRAILALGIAASFGAVLAVHHALPGLLGQFEATVDGGRLDILGITLTAAHAFLPAGSGFGTFQAVYLMYDRPDALLTGYVNHAHNDWAELWLEGGWLFALVAAGFLAWLARATWATWRAIPGRSAEVDALLGRAASITVCLLLVHSLVDYPLRTVGLLSVFALCCALLIPPPLHWTRPAAHS